jgi:hypothetical protein
VNSCIDWKRSTAGLLSSAELSCQFYLIYPVHRNIKNGLRPRPNAAGRSLEMKTTLPADAHVANVTGASHGIGGTIALRFAADGGAVVMSIVADQNRAARLRRVGSGDLLARRDYVHVRAEVSDAA